MGSSRCWRGRRTARPGAAADRSCRLRSVFQVSGDMVMTLTRLPTAVLLVWLAATDTAAAQQPPSYARQVRPLFAKYCLECHNAKESKGDLNLETFPSLMKGGKSGPVVVPGKPDESLLVLLPEGKEKPPMPPKTARQPKPNEITVLRAWVAAGAKDDSASITVTIPDIKPRSPVFAPVAALAYRPDGKLLAAGGHREVLLIDPSSGEVVGKLPGLAAEVTALVFSPD